MKVIIMLKLLNNINLGKDSEMIYIQT